jgi:hypothetical protein
MITKEDFKYVEFERDVDLSQPLMVRSDKRNRINAIDIAFLYETAAELSYLSHPNSSMPAKLRLGALKSADLKAVVDMFCSAFHFGYFYSFSAQGLLKDHECKSTWYNFEDELKNYRFDCPSFAGANVIIPEGRDASPLYADRNLVMAQAIYDIERRFIYNANNIKGMFALWSHKSLNGSSFQSIKEEPFPVDWDTYVSYTDLPNIEIEEYPTSSVYLHWWNYNRSGEDIRNHTGFSIGGDGELYFWPYIEDELYGRLSDLHKYFGNADANIRTFVDIHVERWHSSEKSNGTEHDHGYYRLEGYPYSSRAVSTGYINQITALGGLKDDHRQPLIDSAAVASANANEDWDSGDYFYLMQWSHTYYIFNPLARIVKMFEL